MAIDLKAIFRVQDNGTSKLRKIMQQTEKLSKSTQQATKATNTYRDAQGRLRDAMGRFVSGSNKAVSANKRFATSLSGLRVSASGVGASLSGLQSSLVGIAGAYLTAQGAAKAFDATIGAAARYEQSEAVIRATFQDDGKTKQYMDMVDKIAIDSPLLNSGDMFASSKGLLTLSTDMSQLETAWGIVERLIASDPTKSIDDAVRGMRELSSGDTQSLREVFNLDKNILNDVKDLSFDEQLAGISKMLSKMNITEETVTAMGSTTLGYWAQIEERVSKVMRLIGSDGNSKLGKALGGIVNSIDENKMNEMANVLGDKLGEIVDKAIVIGQWLWKWREPVAYIVGALTAATGAFMLIGALSLLANPIALIGAGVAALVVGFKALYDNSEPVRNVIDGIIDKGKELFNAFKSGGVSGLLDAILPPGTVEALSARFATIKEQLAVAFGAISGVVLPILQSAWGLIQPILSGLWTALKIVADVAMVAWNNVLAPAIKLVGAAFTTMWGLTGPILELLGATISAAFAVLKVVWDTIVGPFVAFLGGVFTTAFGMATEVVGALTPVFETLGGWISKAAGYLQTFADLIKSIKVPDWIGSISSKGVEWAKKLIPGKDRADGSHYHGLDNVPYDGYTATLHRGERIMTAQENKEYSQGDRGKGDVLITGNQFIVREEADIKKVALELAKLVEREALQRG